MRLVNPSTGSVVEATDPGTVVSLRYGKGYWPLDDGPTAPVDDAIDIPIIEIVND